MRAAWVRTGAEAGVEGVGEVESVEGGEGAPIRLAAHGQAHQRPVVQRGRCNRVIRSRADASGAHPNSQLLPAIAYSSLLPLKHRRKRVSVLEKPFWVSLR